MKFMKWFRRMERIAINIGIITSDVNESLADSHQTTDTRHIVFWSDEDLDFTEAIVFAMREKCNVR